MSGTNDPFDHEVDGIRELDNALPRWWLYGFYVTILFAAAYLVNYQLLATPIIGSRSQAAEYEADIAAHPRAVVAAALAMGSSASAGLKPLTSAHELDEGRKIFESSTHPCHACHRPDLGGLVGPNLTDNEWLHGCSIGEVMQSIRTGYPLQGMVPFGGGPALSDEQLLELGSYILSKRDSRPPTPKPTDPTRDRACPPAGI